MTKPRQLAPTVGPAHNGVEFSKGAPPGFGSYATGLMTRSRRGKYYINNLLWGPEADSIESGYRVPFGKINVFVGMVESPMPEPDTSSDIVEPARYIRPVVTPNLTRPVFVGFTQGSEEPEHSATQETTPVNTDDESSMGDSDSIQSLHGGCLGACHWPWTPKFLTGLAVRSPFTWQGRLNPRQTRQAEMGLAKHLEARPRSWWS